MQKEEAIVCSIAVCCLTAISVTALLRGIDGTIIAGISGVIGTIIGYIFGKTREPPE
jgi:hypothetical protein